MNLLIDGIHNLRCLIAHANDAWISRGSSDMNIVEAIKEISKRK